MPVSENKWHTTVILPMDGEHFCCERKNAYIATGDRGDGEKRHLRAFNWAVGRLITLLLVLYCRMRTAFSVFNSTRMCAVLGSGTPKPAGHPHVLCLLETGKWSEQEGCSLAG